MGSFYGTCGVTQLPILDGDEVVVFLLIDNQFPDELKYELSNNGHCHSNTFWTPFSLQLTGYYNDYSQFIVNNDWNKQTVIDRLQEFAVELPVGKNEMHDIAVTKEQLKSWKFVQKAIIKDRLFVDAFQKRRSIGVMAVHKKVFDRLVNGVSMYAEGPSIERLISDADVYISECEKHLKDLPDDAPDEDFDFITRSTRFKPSRNSFASFYYYNYTENNFGSIPSAHSYYKTELMKKLKAGEDINDMIDDMCAFAVFANRMEVLRKTWMPQSGLGSQCQEHDLHKLVSETAIEICNKHAYDDAL